MKVTASLAVGLASLVSQATCHYIFETFSPDGETATAFQYVRQNTNYNSPVTDLASDDLRCNEGGATGGETSTAAVVAGSSVTFTSDVAVYHNGPISVYLAKAPSTAAEFDGSGDVWAKILDIGPTFPGGTWDLKQSYTFDLPACIEDGEYLLRIQSLAIHNPWPGGIPQFYVECAQISVTGGGSTVLSPAVAIPGAFHETDPGYTANIYSDFTSYTVPGPEVATC